MDLLEQMLQGSGGGGMISDLAAKLGIDEGMVQTAVSALAPALANAGGDHAAAAAEAAASSGLDAGLLAQLAPMLQGLVSGQGGGDLLSTVTSMLDQDRDGSAVDDVLGMAQKMFGQK